MDTKGLQKEFISWCKSKNKSPKSEDETKQLFVAFMKEKHPEEYKQAVQNQQKQQQAQAKKAAHGTKLNYFKSLKNQCAEDEEVVYFKKGGSVKCGCKKKEDGGEIAKAQKGSAVDKFKNRQKSEKKDIQWTNKDDRKLDSLVMRKEYHKKPLTQQGEKDLKDLKERFKKSSNKNKYEVQEEKCGGKVKKKEDGSKINKDCGGAVAKFKAAKCGSKLKKHLQGGSLNRIPFMQAGTPKGGVTTKNGVNIVLPEYMQQTQIGYPSILPGKYSGLERISPSLFNMFKTWIKGLPKSMSTSDKVALGAGTVVGNVLGYDDTHNQYIRKAINNVSEGLNPTIEWTPFSADNIINNIINKPQPKKSKK